MTDLKRSSEGMTQEEAQAVGRALKANWEAGEAAFVKAQGMREQGTGHRRAGWAIAATWGVGAATSAPAGATIAAAAGAFVGQPMALALGAAALGALAVGAWKKGQAARLSVEAVVSTADKVQDALSLLTPENQKTVLQTTLALSKNRQASAFSRVLAFQLTKQSSDKKGLTPLSQQLREMPAREALNIDFIALRRAQKELEKEKTAQEAQKKKPRV